jgi:propanol-preferring alcohol dehydrogenase
MDVHIPGHEGIGTVVKLGSDVGNERLLGQRVGIKWIHETCGDCEICQRDLTACPNQHNSGRDRPGTLQEYVAVPAKHASPIPDGISGHIAAPLLCGKRITPDLSNITKAYV